MTTFATYADVAADVEPLAPLKLRVGEIQVEQLAPEEMPIAAGHQPARVVLQLSHRLTAERLQGLRELGVRVLEYVPRNAYLAELGAATPDEVKALPFVANLTPFRKQWKVSPRLAALTPEGDRAAVGQAKRLADPVDVYRANLPADRQALLDAGSVKVMLSSFRGVEQADVLTALDGLPAVEVVGSIEVHGRVIADAIVPVNALAELADLAVVQFIEDAPVATLRNATTGPLLQSGNVDFTPVWDRGLSGWGEIVGVIDAGPRTDHCMFEDQVQIGTDHRKFAAHWPMTEPMPDPHAHGTHVIGVLAGDSGVEGIHDPGDGLAFGARVAYGSFWAVSQQGTSLMEALVDADASGARIHSNSFGSDASTAYTNWCTIIDAFSHAYEDNLVIFAATNLATLRTPENAKNVLAVGATLRYPEQMSHYKGGEGPTVDGRRKPEIYAPGRSIESASSSGDSCGLRTDSGTSFAAPAVAAGAALVRQYFRDGFYPSGAANPADSHVPTGSLMKAMLLNATDDMTGVPDYPSNKEGWGLLNLDRSLYFAGEPRRLVMRDRRHAEGISDAGAYSFEITVLDSSEDLRITMVFNDPPAAPGVSDPVVNDLDLLIIDPTGDFCFGNVFANGQSISAGYPDSRNNVEQILLKDPPPGVYSVIVIGTFVRSVNPFAPEQLLDNQGFAIAASGTILDGAFNVTADFADADFDGDRDLADFAVLQRCAGDAASANGLAAPCTLFDADIDGRVDAVDYDVFELFFEGPDTTPQF